MTFLLAANIFVAGAVVGFILGVVAVIVGLLMWYQKHYLEFERRQRGR